MSFQKIDTPTLSKTWASNPPGTRLFGGLGTSEISIAILFGVYCALFIFKSSFKIGDVRYFCLFDDDMISMRYAANFARGHGLLWNPGGERILGFTNPLWVLYMAFFHLFPIAPPRLSLCIQISGALILLFNLFIVRAICKELVPEARSIPLVAMALTAFYGPLNNWGLQGTEVSILTMLVSLSVWLALPAVKSPSRYLSVYLLLGISTLIRPDMAVFSIALLLAMAVLSPNRRLAHLFAGLAIVAVFLLLQAAFNFFYYGDLLPNTYYLKMTGFPPQLRIFRGIRVGIIFLLPWIPIAIAVSLNGFRTYPSRACLLATAVVAQFAYSVWVGGDAWEWYGGSNRYLSIAMPMVFVLTAIGLEGMVDRIGRRFGIPRHRSLIRLAFVATLLLLVNAVHLRTNLLLTRPIQTDGNEDMVRQAILLRNVTDERARVAVTGRELFHILRDVKRSICSGKTIQRLHTSGCDPIRSYSLDPSGSGRDI